MDEGYIYFPKNYVTQPTLVSVALSIESTMTIDGELFEPISPTIDVQIDGNLGHVENLATVYVKTWVDCSGEEIKIVTRDEKSLTWTLTNIQCKRDKEFIVFNVPHFSIFFAGKKGANKPLPGTIYRHVLYATNHSEKPKSNVHIIKSVIIADSSINKWWAYWKYCWLDEFAMVFDNTTFTLDEAEKFELRLKKEEENGIEIIPSKAGYEVVQDNLSEDFIKHEQQYNIRSKSQDHVDLTYRIKVEHKKINQEQPLSLSWSN